MTKQKRKIGLAEIISSLIVLILLFIIIRLYIITPPTILNEYDYCNETYEGSWYNSQKETPFEIRSCDIIEDNVIKSYYFSYSNDYLRWKNEKEKNNEKNIICPQFLELNKWKCKLN